MFCEKCGAKNSKENSFCEKCGERLNPEEEKVSEKNKEDSKREEVVTRKTETRNMELLFEKEKYYSYIGKIQRSVTMTYVYWIGFGLIISFMILAGASYQDEFSHFGSHHDGEGMMQIFAIFPPIIGFVIAHARTLEKKIRVQEMKWRMDFYSKHIH